MDQDNRKPRLIWNSTAALNGITPSVNVSTDKGSTPRAIQFGACLPRFLQKVWEADPAEGPVWLFKWDITNASHRCPLRAAHIGAFTCVVPPLPSDTTILLCIDLVLPMGWVNSPDMFCSASETVADMANGYILYLTSPFQIYPPTANKYTTAPAPTASSARLQCTEVYKDDLLSATEGDMNQQQRVSARKAPWPSTR